MDLTRRWEKVGLIHKPYNEASLRFSNSMETTSILLN